jgi:hypothetical protein
MASQDWAFATDFDLLHYEPRLMAFGRVLSTQIHSGSGRVYGGSEVQDDDLEPPSFLQLRRGMLVFFTAELVAAGVVDFTSSQLLLSAPGSEEGFPDPRIRVVAAVEGATLAYSIHTFPALRQMGDEVRNLLDLRQAPTEALKPFLRHATCLGTLMSIYRSMASWDSAFIEGPMGPIGPQTIFRQRNWLELSQWYEKRYHRALRQTRLRLNSAGDDAGEHRHATSEPTLRRE